MNKRIKKLLVGIVSATLIMAASGGIYGQAIEVEQIGIQANVEEVQVVEPNIFILLHGNKQIGNHELRIYCQVPKESQSALCEVYQNGKLIKTYDILETSIQEMNGFILEVPIAEVGKYTYKANLIIDGVKVKEATSLEIEQYKEMQPAKLICKTNSTGDVLIRSVLLHYGELKKYVLYENGKPIEERKVDTAYVNKDIEMPNFVIKNRQPGTYTYEIIAYGNNAEGVVSIPAIVEVKEATKILKTGALKVTKVGEEETGIDVLTIDINIPEASGATKYEVYYNGFIVLSGDVERDRNAIAAIEKQLDYRGSLSLIGDWQLVLSNEEGYTISESQIFTREVPITHTAISKNEDNTLQFLWENATDEEYVVFVYENDRIVYTLLCGAGSENQVKIPVHSSIKPGDTAQYHLEALYGEGLYKSEVLSYKIPELELVPAGPVPAEPVVAHNCWNGEENYSITFNMWYGVNGTSWRLYENDKLIFEESLVANGTSAQQGNANMKNKAAGTYTYYAELVNENGVTKSKPITVTVNPILPGTPVLSYQRNNTAYTIDMNMWYGNNGSEWELYENDKLIITRPLKVNDKNAQKDSYTIENQTPGTYTYYAVLVGRDGKTTSEPITVNVSY